MSKVKSKKKTNKRQENIMPIRNLSHLRILLQGLKDHSDWGEEYYMVWEVCMHCFLRESDGLKLHMYGRNGVYHKDGTPKTFLTDQQDTKTHKPNTLNLKSLKHKLIDYKDWRTRNNIKSSYLFPAPRDTSRPLRRQTYYAILKRVADFCLGKKRAKFIGSHSSRKTGALLLYRSCGSLAVVCHRLNQSSQRVTMLYLGITSKTEENDVDNTWKKFNV